MKIVVLLSQKGGTGKSTIATHLAVCAELKGKSVALFDIDPQASSYKWSKRRRENTLPVIAATAAELSGLIKKAKGQAADLILIDTPGHADAASLHALSHADLVLIPCRPSAADLDAIEDTIALVKRAKPKKSAVEERMNVCPIALGQRSAYANAWIDGRSVEEYDSHGKAADEIRQLYDWMIKY
jgi:chromosome partitioning protein